MNKKSVFVVLFAMLCLAVFTVSVSADQDGLDRYCNSDQYGCWVTGDGGSQDYIMFWSEYARDLFMGPGSNAVVTDPVPAGRMSLGKASVSAEKELSREEKISALVDFYLDQYIKQTHGTKAGLTRYYSQKNDQELDTLYNDMEQNQNTQKKEESSVPEKKCYKNGTCKTDEEIQRDINNIMSQHPNYSRCEWNDERSSIVCYNK